MVDVSDWSLEVSGSTLPLDPPLPPPDVELPTFAERTHTVSASATGGGSGTDASPWTLAEACANCQPGMVIGLRKGVYVGTPTYTWYIPSFSPANSGTETYPIYFVAEHLAALPSTAPADYTEIKSGGEGTHETNPAFGVKSGVDYCNWIGVYTDGTHPNNDDAKETGHVTVWGAQYCGLYYCRVIYDPIKCGTPAPGQGIDNQACVRLENTEGCTIRDCYLEGADNNNNGAGIMTYRSRRMTVENCEIVGCQNGIQLKGGWTDDLPEEPGGHNGLVIRFCKITARKPIRLHSTAALIEADMQRVYCNLLIASNNITEQTSSGSGGYRSPSDAYYWYHFYNNTCHDNANEGALYFHVNVQTDGVVDKNGAWSNNVVSKHFYVCRSYGLTAAGFDGLFSGPGGQWNRNAYRSVGGGIVALAGGIKRNFAEMQAAGWDIDSIIDVDLMLDADYRPLPGSPVIGLGRDIHGDFGPVGGVINAGCYATDDVVLGIRG